MITSAIQREFFSQLIESFTGETLFDYLTDTLFFIKNIRGQYIVINQALVERCGYESKDDIIGKTSEEVYPEPLGREYLLQDIEIINKGKPILNQLELHLFPSHVTGWCITNKVPLHGKDGSVIGLAGLTQDLYTPGKKTRQLSQIARAVNYIKDHYAKALKVDDIAELAGLSTYQFEQRIQSIFHLTAGQFIQKTRMDAAIWKLSQTDEPLAHIALSCGYADQSAFSRQFKMAVGISPAQYRKMVKKRITDRVEP